MHLHDEDMSGFEKLAQSICQTDTRPIPYTQHPSPEIMLGLFDGQINPHVRTQVHSHLALCSRCAARFREMSGVLRSETNEMKGMKHVSSLPVFLESRTEKLRVSRRQRTRITPRGRSRRPWWGYATALSTAAAAAICLLIVLPQVSRLSKEVDYWYSSYRQSSSELEALQGRPSTVIPPLLVRAFETDPGAESLPMVAYSIEMPLVEIVLNGERLIYLPVGAEYEDLGARFYSMRANEDITTDMMITTNSVDTSSPGTYEVIYKIDHGEVALRAVRTVEVLSQPIVKVREATVMTTTGTRSSAGGPFPVYQDDEEVLITVECTPVCNKASFSLQLPDGRKLDLGSTSVDSRWFTVTLNPESLFVADGNYAFHVRASAPGYQDGTVSHVFQYFSRDRSTQITRVIGVDGDDSGAFGLEALDGGYVLVGSTQPHGEDRSVVRLLKLDRNGNTQWERIFDMGADTSARADHVMVARDGGLVITATVWGAREDAWGSDMWMIRTDSRGNPNWDRIIGGDGFDYAQAVVETQDGGFVLLGEGAENMLLVKYDAQGNMVWRRDFRWFSAAAQDFREIADGSLIVLGTAYTEETSSGWLIKTTKEGEVVWSKLYGGDGDDRGSSVQQTPDGGYFVVGSTQSYGAADQSIWLLRIDSDGDWLWYKTFGERGHSRASDAQLTSDNGLVIVGECEDRICLMRVDAEGKEIWNRDLGDSIASSVESVVVSIDGGFIIVGTTSGGATSNQAWYLNDDDLWFIRTDSEGNIK